MDYPEDWNQLPRRERRKKIKELNRERGQKADSFRKIRHRGLLIVVLVAGIFGFFKTVSHRGPGPRLIIKQK